VRRRRIRPAGAGLVVTLLGFGLGPASGATTGGTAPSVTFTRSGAPAGTRIAAPAGANDLEANMNPHTGVIANAFWTKGGHALGPVKVPAGATGLVLRTSPTASPGTLLARPPVATAFHVFWAPSGPLTSATWIRVGKVLTTIPVAGRRAIAFTNGVG
jgi:hypothetical protein